MPRKMNSMQTPLEFLAHSNVPHVVIGGHAVRAYGYARQTVDFDCMIATESETDLAAFLSQHGYREAGRTSTFIRFWATDRTRGDLDVMLVDSDTFGKINAESQQIELGSFSVRVPALAHLIALKLHALKSNPRREAKDTADIVELLRERPDAVSDAELEKMCDLYAPTGYLARLRELLKR